MPNFVFDMRFYFFLFTYSTLIKSIYFRTTCTITPSWFSFFPIIRKIKIKSFMYKKSHLLQGMVKTIIPSQISIFLFKNAYLTNTSTIPFTFAFPKYRIIRVALPASDPIPGTRHIISRSHGCVHTITGFPYLCQ